MYQYSYHSMKTSQSQVELTQDGGPVGLYHLVMSQPSEFVSLHTMFAQNHLMTHFAEHTPFIKQSTTVITINTN